MRLRLLQEIEVDKKVDREIRGGYCNCFPGKKKIFSESRYFKGTPPSWLVVAECADKIVGHIAIVERNIKICNNDAFIAGIQGVYVLPEYQEQNIFHNMMSLDIEEIQRLKYDYCLLFIVL